MPEKVLENGSLAQSFQLQFGLLDGSVLGQAVRFNQGCLHSHVTGAAQTAVIVLEFT